MSSVGWLLCGAAHADARQTAPAGSWPSWPIHLQHCTRLGPWVPFLCTGLLAPFIDAQRDWCIHLGAQGGRNISPSSRVHNRGQQLRPGRNSTWQELSRKQGAACAQQRLNARLLLLPLARVSLPQQPQRFFSSSCR